MSWRRVSVCVCVRVRVMTYACFVGRDPLCVVWFVCLCCVCSCVCYSCAAVSFLCGLFCDVVWPAVVVGCRYV